MQINIIKFGGSVISDKLSEDHFNLRNTERLARELYPFHNGSILIHGTGYVGKPPAVKYGYVRNGIISKEEKLIALTVRSKIRQLNQHVVNTLISASIPAIPIDILNYFSFTQRSGYVIKTGIIIFHLVKNGLVPVLYGDLFPLPDGSYKVISSDFITFLLAKNLKPDNVIFLSNVRGIFMSKEAVEEDNIQGIIKKLTLDKLTSIKWTDSDNNDVSGGMRRKAELALEASDYCNKCFIGSGYTENLLSKLFTEEDVEGTFVRRSF